MRKFPSIKDLRARDGIAESTRWAMVKAGLYPRPVKFGPRSTRWIIEEVEAHEARIIAASRGEVVS